MSKGKILISGASGLIGEAISSSLTAQGFVVNRLARKPGGNISDVVWDPSQPIAPEKVSGFDVVIHLAGENIFGVWTKEKKERIRDSRVIGTKNLVAGLVHAERKPRVLLCSSAILDITGTAVMKFYLRTVHLALNFSLKYAASGKWKQPLRWTLAFVQ